MHILHLYKDYHPIVGGIENHIKTLAEAQAAAGHTVTVLVTNPGGQAAEEMLNGVHVMRVPRMATVASTPLTLYFPAVLRRIKADITHLQFPYPIGEICQYFSGRRPYVISYQSDIVRGSQQAFLRLYRPLLRRVLRGAACILASSQNYIDSSPYLQPVAARCQVVPLGIHPQPFLDAVPAHPPSQSLRLLFVGRHRYYKGVDDLLRAVKSLDVELWIAGSGPMRPEWEGLAADLALGERVRFLGDVADRDLPALYASADVFVLPSNARSEAFGIVLLEAMAAGLPCITTELGTGSSFIVQDGVTGLVVPPRDPPALARAIASMQSGPGLRKQLGQAGRARLLEAFTLEKMVQRVEAVYSNCSPNS
ncbi:MAG: glycosyltransferase [Chloroflexota bacterium]